MSSAFDPYHRWLGISPKDQPPDHYRLLSVDRFERDPEVIRDAAERQMGHVRRYALGQHSDLSQRLLNELGAAKACLMDPLTKAAYDERLRTALVPPADVPPLVEPPPPPVGTEATPPSAKNARLDADSPPAGDTAREPIATTARPSRSTAVALPLRKLASDQRGESGPADKPPPLFRPLRQYQPALETLLPRRLDAYLASVAGPDRPGLRDLLRVGVVVSPLFAIGLVIVALLAVLGPRQTARTEMPVVAGLPHELDGEASRSEERLPSRFPDDEPIEPPSEGPEADNKVVGQPQPCAAKSFDTPPPPLEKPTDGDAPPKPLPRSPKPDTPPEPLEHKPIEPPPLVVAPFSAEVARQHQEAWAKHLGLVLEVTNSIGMKLVLLPPGEFVMGSPVSETDRGDDEDQHPRRITKAFYLGIYEVTQAEYERVTKTNPSSFSADGPHQSRTSKLDTSRRPVEAVSWDDAVAFCNELSTCADEQRARRKYRLPTEEEWEYACRAGSTGPFHFGATLNGREANCNGGSPYGTTVKGSNRLRTTNVGLYPPNAWGLHDMHGNVWEWCLDAYTPKDALDRTSGLPRALRGGSWSNRPVHCRSAFRHSEAPAARRDFIGFRVACDCE